MEWAGNENDQTICQHILRWVTVSEKGTIEKKKIWLPNEQHLKCACGCKIEMLENSDPQRASQNMNSRHGLTEEPLRCMKGPLRAVRVEFTREWWQQGRGLVSWLISACSRSSISSVLPSRGCRAWPQGGERRGAGVCDAGHRGPSVVLAIRRGVLGEIGEPRAEVTLSLGVSDKALDELLWGALEEVSRLFPGGLQPTQACRCLIRLVVPESSIHSHQLR